MKKIPIIFLLLLLVSGCSIEVNNSEKVSNEINNDNIYFYIDQDTCVEYIAYIGNYKAGITNRLNADGTVKLNEECLNRKGE